MLLDLTLPDGDGLLVLERLHTDGAAPRVTVAVTGRDEPEVRARCLAAGCHDVLVKPIAPLELPGQIRRWLTDG
jgi:CheY-like chemotaxis protein